MKERLKKFVHGEIISFIFYILFGLCLIFVPTHMVNMICKILFGVVLMGVGGYNIYRYVGEKASTTILDLFSGVIVFVLGAFLFFNPQVVVKLLPFLLGAFILVDSIWTLRGAFRLYKRSRKEWKLLLIGGLVFIALAVVLLVNPFVKVTHTVIFAGWVFLCNGVADMVLFFLLKHGMKKADEAVQVVEATVEKDASQIADKSGQKADAPEPEIWKETEPVEVVPNQPVALVQNEIAEKAEVTEEPTEAVQPEVLQSESAKASPAESTEVLQSESAEAAQPEIPRADIPKADIPKAEVPKADLPKEDIPETKIPRTEIPSASVWGLDDDDEVLEEWKDE